MAAPPPDRVESTPNTPLTRHCSGCAAAPGEIHTWECTRERCRLCGEAIVPCACIWKISGKRRTILARLIGNWTDEPDDAMIAAYLAAVEAKGGRVVWDGK